MRWAWVVMVLAACSPETVTICENRGSNPVEGVGACTFCGCDDEDAAPPIDREACTDPRCVCREREDPGTVLEFRTADCTACGLWCEPPQLPCGARCVGPDEACPDRPSAWACRTREVPSE